MSYHCRSVQRPSNSAKGDLPECHELNNYQKKDLSQDKTIPQGLVTNFFIPRLTTGV